MVQGRDVGNFIVCSDHRLIPFNEHLRCSLATCRFTDSAVILSGTKSVIVLRLLRTSHEMPYLTGPFLSLFLQKMQFRTFDETPEI